MAIADVHKKMRTLKFEGMVRSEEPDTDGKKVWRTFQVPELFHAEMPAFNSGLFSEEMRKWPDFIGRDIVFKKTRRHFSGIAKVRVVDAHDSRFTVIAEPLELTQEETQEQPSVVVQPVVVLRSAAMVTERGEITRIANLYESGQMSFRKIEKAENLHQSSGMTAWRIWKKAKDNGWI